LRERGPWDDQKKTVQTGGTYWRIVRSGGEKAGKKSTMKNCGKKEETFDPSTHADQ
jgi:hypothetical protein